MIKVKKLPTIQALKDAYEYDAGSGMLLSSKTGRFIKTTNANGYIRVVLKGEELLGHRVAWKLFYGEEPDGFIDHINGVVDDNRITNLRVVTHKENMKNQKKSKRNKSGTQGVHFHTRDKLWIAQIREEGKVKHLGGFKDKVDAIYTRYWAEQDLDYHENHGRV